MSKILVVDDESQVRLSFEKLLRGEGHEVTSFRTAESGLEAIEKNSFDLVIMDVRLPGMDGLEAAKRISAHDAKLPVIIMTAYGSTETAIEATKQGAYDYVLKPFDVPEMLNLIAQALKAGRFMRQPVSMSTVNVDDETDALVGQSKPMRDIYKDIGRAAPTDATVLIRGESGTGKELAARAVYQHSLRQQRPFMVINCVAIPETLLESELFGYERGAFTGANHRRLGKIEQASGGTVFLDEIGDMPLSIQAKVLRLVQERSIERLGGRQPIPVDVRIIAATNRDLEAAVEDGRFRQDLYYRLNVVSLRMPPLRHRKEDIADLASFFLARFATQMHIDNPGLTKEALSCLMRYDWPGNVRELANVIQKILIFNPGGAIGQEEVQAAIRPMPRSPGPQEDQSLPFGEYIRQVLAQGGAEATFVELMDRFAVKIISEALSMTGGNRTRAANLLGLSRPTLLAKIEKYKLKMETSVHEEPDAS